MNSNSSKQFFLNNYGLAIFFAIMGLVLSCVLFCVRDVAKKVPTNYILLAAFTFCEAYVVAFCTATVNNPETVVAAAFMTAGIVGGLTLYAMTTKSDFTVCGGSLFMIGAAFIMFGLFSFMFGPTMRLVYCTLGVILFGFYLVVDTQLVLGGKRYSLDKDEYIFGAIILYLDILNIFLYLLQILAAFSK